jgi:hypothetical protein
MIFCISCVLLFSPLLISILALHLSLFFYFVAGGLELSRYVLPVLCRGCSSPQRKLALDLSSPLLFVSQSVFSSRRLERAPHFLQLSLLFGVARPGADPTCPGLFAFPVRVLSADPALVGFVFLTCSPVWISVRTTVPVTRVGAVCPHSLSAGLSKSVAPFRLCRQWIFVLPL